MYVSLEPCDHTGATPPCTRAIVGSGIRRIVVGAMDPNPRTAGRGVRRLRDAGISVDVANDALALGLVEAFARAVTTARPYVRLKMASSLDGYVAPEPGDRHWLTGYEARAYVRDLRASHDAVLVGAGTVRIDDPQLCVRPARSRRTPYRRVVACESAPVPRERAIFERLDGYAQTIVLAPAGMRDAFAALEEIADVLYVGATDARALDLADALVALRARDVTSVLCEGGPTLAAHLLADGLVDRCDWLLAPALLSGERAVPVLARDFGGTTLRFDRVEWLGPDVLVSAVPVERG